MAELLTRLYLGQYEKHAIMDKWKKVLYVRLKKSLYGTLKAAPLVWENLSNNLMKKWGFKLNPYEKCVAYKTISGRQHTIQWQVDDLKISHSDSNIVDNIIEILDKEHGQGPETPLMVHWGNTHD